MKRITGMILLLGGLIIVFFTTNKEKATASAIKIVDSLHTPVLTESISKERADRVKRGDTLTLSNTELLDLLPDRIQNYHPSGTPGSSLVNLMGNQYRVAEQIYKQKKQTLKISIADYNAAYTLYNVATSTFASGVSIDNNEQIIRPVSLSLKDAKGWETFDKKAHKATVFVGIGERFLITLEATEQNTPHELEQVVGELDIAPFVGR